MITVATYHLYNKQIYRVNKDKQTVHVRVTDSNEWENVSMFFDCDDKMFNDKNTVTDKQVNEFMLYTKMERHLKNEILLKTHY